jgi:predicted Ser/Thr protein kinase
VNFPLFDHLRDKLHKIGEGGFSKVYPLNNNEFFVVRELVNAEHDSELRERLQTESKILNILSSSDVELFREYYKSLTFI